MSIEWQHMGMALLGLGAWLIVSFRIKNLKKHVKRILDLLEKDGGSNE